MSDLEQTSPVSPKRVNHDWAFFAFIAAASILVAAAFTWASIKSGDFSREQTSITAPDVRPGSLE